MSTDASSLEVTTFSEIRKGDVIQLEDGGKTSTATIVNIDHSGRSLLPIAVRIGLVTYAYDNERDTEVTVLSRAVDTED